MNPGEAERKLKKLEQEYEEQAKELAAYKEFFDASLAMNINAAALKEARRVHDAMRAVEVIRIRKGVSGSQDSALKALKNIS